MECREREGMLAEYFDGTLDRERTDALLDHVESCAACRAEFRAYEEQERQLRRFFVRDRARAEALTSPLRAETATPTRATVRARCLRWLTWAAAAVVVAALGPVVWRLYHTNVPTGHAQLAVVSELDGRALVLTPGTPAKLEPGNALHQSQRVKVLPGCYLAVRLADGNTLEVNGGTLFALNDYPDRFEVVTERGQVWAHLGAKPPKPFVVRTAHVAARATGTVYGVAEGLDRTEVDVARGTVQVESGGTWTSVGEGETFVSRQGLGKGAPAAMVAWSHLKPELAALVPKKGTEESAAPLVVAAGVTSPGNAGGSTAVSAVDYLPEETRYLLAIDDARGFAKDIGASDWAALTANPQVRDWWMAVGGPRAFEDAAKELPLEEVAAVARCLDGQLAVGVDLSANLVVVADCGANAARVGVLVEQIALKKERASGANGASAAAKAGEEVRSRFAMTGQWLVFSSSPGLARATRQRIAATQPTGFTRGAFYAKVHADAPSPRFLIAGNLEGQVGDLIRTVKSENLDGEFGTRMTLLGFTSLDYVLLSPDFSGHGTNQAARLAFGPGGRTGAMDWLAEPSPMRGLDFFSPDVHAFASFVVRNPYRIASDYLAYLRDTHQEGDFRQVLEVVQKNEAFLRSFGGEVAVGVDSPVLPIPNLKIAIEVADQEAFRDGLENIVTDVLDRFARQGRIATIEDTTHGGQTVYSLVIDGVPISPAWAFVDGYFVAGPGPQFVLSSLDVHASHRSIASDSRLASLLPGNLDMGFSMLLYQDIARSVPAVFREAIAPKLLGADGATTATAATFRLMPALDAFRDCRAPSVAYAFARPQSVDLYLNAPAGLDFNMGVGAPLVAQWLVPRTSIGATIDKVARAQFGLEQLQKATLQFQAENGRLPASIEELATPAGKYIGAVPADPFGAQGASLRLAPGPSEGQVTLYSVGPDGVDDDGKVEYSIVRKYDGPGDIVLRVGSPAAQ